MKRVFMIIALLCSVSAIAQDGAVKKDNLLFLVRNKEHITQAIRTIRDMKTCRESSVVADTAVIIVCGEAVTSLAQPGAKNWVAEINSLDGVSLVACGLSLEKFNIPAASLVPGIGTIKNGLVTAFELQKRGYLSVEL